MLPKSISSTFSPVVAAWMQMVTAQLFPELPFTKAQAWGLGRCISSISNYVLGAPKGFSLEVYFVASPSPIVGSGWCFMFPSPAPETIQVPFRAISAVDEVRFLLFRTPTVVHSRLLALGPKPVARRHRSKSEGPA